MSVLSIEYERGDGARRSYARPRATEQPSPLSAAEPTIKVYDDAQLKSLVTQEVLRLFRLSLLVTLGFSGALVLIDAAFITAKLILPAERLITETTITTLIAATVAQAGAAFAAIVFSVFKSGKANAE
jgi:hypothetical protein